MNAIARGITGVAVVVLTAGSLSGQENRALAHRFVAVGKDVTSLSGHGSTQLKDGRTLFGGDVKLPGTHLYEEVRWLACVTADGQVQWSTRAEEHGDAASLFLLASDGESIWHIGVTKDGLYQAAKFDGRTLRKQAAIQIPFAPITMPSPYVAFYDRGDRDLQMSMLQPVGGTIRLAILSSDLKMVFDKTYTFSLGSTTETGKSLVGAYLNRLPDRSGYYLFLRQPVRSGVNSANAGLGIVRLDNDGTVKWANSYDVGYARFADASPRTAADGSILVHMGGDNIVSNDTNLIRISPDGAARWGVTIKGVPVMLTDFTDGGVSYRFTEPYLFATSLDIVRGGTVSSLFAFDYATGKLEKQVRFSPKSTGAVGFVDKDSDSIYLSLLDSFSSSGGSKTALLRFGFDLKLRAARAVRNSEPHWPMLDSLAGGNLLFSYSYEARKSFVAETISKNFESTKSCGLAEKLDLSVTGSNLQAVPFQVGARPLPPIKVADSNARIGEGHVTLVPFELRSEPCTAGGD